MLDAASLPGVSDAKQGEVFNVRIVGGGAIGMEATAKLYDLWNEDMRFSCPHQDGKMTISIHDVAPTILSTFDAASGDSALESLQKKNVVIKTGSHIDNVDATATYTKEDDTRDFPRG